MKMLKNLSMGESPLERLKKGLGLIVLLEDPKFLHELCHSQGLLTVVLYKLPVKISKPEKCLKVL